MRPMLAICTGVVLPPILAVCAVLLLNHGQFAYPLEASYVHLALADQILHGHYGINPGEPASPSSTILFPYLLAGLTALGLGRYAGLLPCLVALAASGMLLAMIAEECGIALRRIGTAGLVLLGAALSLALNFTGLTLAGLEHAPHVALTLVSLLGLIRFVRRREADWWWLASVVLLPLIRFEALAAVLADILVLLVFRKWRHALGVMLVTVLLVGGFGLYLMSLGLPFLPESVLQRSMVAGTGTHLERAGLLGMLQTVYANTRVNLLAYGGTHILLAMLLCVWGSTRGIGAWRHDRGVQVRLTAAGFFLVVGLAQMLAGSLVSVSRYEIYVLTLGLGALMVVFAAETDALLRRRAPFGPVALSLTILVVGAGYALRTVDAVKSAHAMQLVGGTVRQFLVEDWRAPVAVTRYGMLSWRNPWTTEPIEAPPRGGPPGSRPGSAEADARQLAANVVARHNIRLAVLDPESAALAPEGWEKVAEFRLPHGDQLGFDLYAVNRESREAILAALERFRTRLAGPVQLRLPDDTPRQLACSGGTPGCLTSHPQPLSDRP